MKCPFNDDALECPGDCFFACMLRALEGIEAEA